MAAFTDYSENLIIDWLWRGQAAPVLPAAWYFGLLTEVPSDTGTGLIEAAGGSYARVMVQRSLAGFAGTQGVGSTAISNGATGATSNNVLIAFPAPTADWGLVKAVAVFDAAIGGNCWFAGPLAEERLIRAGDAPATLLAGAFGFVLDAT